MIPTLGAISSVPRDHAMGHTVEYGPRNARAHQYTPAGVFTPTGTYTPAGGLILRESSLLREPTPAGLFIPAGGLILRDSSLLREA
jgi:hypothetical protein